MGGNREVVISRSLKYLTPLIMIFFFQGCKKEVELVPEDQFSDIYIDLLRTQDSIGTANVLIKPALDSLLKKYRVSKQLYDNTVQFYMRNPAEFKAFIYKVRARTAELKPKQPAKP